MKDPRISTLLAHAVDTGQANERWIHVEENLEVQLPGAYKRLINLFGASTWCDFLHVLSPFDFRLNLQARGKEILDVMRECRKEFPSHYPLPLFPERGGLLPWAITDNGDTLYFITQCSPDDWPTLIRGPRSPEFEVSFLSPTLLIHHFALGLLQSTILPTIRLQPGE